MKFDLAPTLSASSSKPATRKRRTPPSLVAKLGIVRCHIRHIHHRAHLLKKEFFESHMAPPPQTLPPKGLCKLANPQLKYEPKQQNKKYNEPWFCSFRWMGPMIRISSVTGGRGNSRPENGRILEF